VWDFNEGYGNADYDNSWRTDGWRAQENGIWFTQIIDHPDFRRRLKTKWPEARAAALSNNTIFGVIDRQLAVMAPEIDENFRIWGGLGQYLWPNPYWLNTHAQEVDALKSWIALRTQWMDKAIAEMTSP
jgi:hypothetical protein